LIQNPSIPSLSNEILYINLEYFLYNQWKCNLIALNEF
jgi:hypothetical protein